MNILTFSAVVTSNNVTYHGRPAHIRPIQSWRSPNSRERRHVPHFSQKPGRKHNQRLAKNSLFSANIHGSRGSMHKVSQSQAVSDELNMEDMAIWSTNLSHWDDETYMLRIEEMEIFVDILNAISTQCKLDTWHCISPSVSSHVAGILGDAHALQVCVQSFIVLFHRQITQCLQGIAPRI